VALALAACGDTSAYDVGDAGGGDDVIDEGSEDTSEQDEPPYEGPVGEPETWACGTLTRYVANPAFHLAEEDGTPEYVSNPPCIGSHFGSWLGWGEVEDELDAGFYVHNLEHGGIAYLYDCPAGCENDLIAPLRDYVTMVPDDDGGPFRYVLGPFTGMPNRFGMVAWGVVYVGDEMCVEDLNRFRTEHYRNAPEDIASPGSAD
jgi:hypothetical protein